MWHPLSLLLGLCAFVYYQGFVIGLVVISNSRYHEDTVYLFNNTASFVDTHYLSKNVSLSPGEEIAIDAQEGTIFYALSGGKPYQV